MQIDDPLYTVIVSQQSQHGIVERDFPPLSLQFSFPYYRVPLLYWITEIADLNLLDRHLIIAIHITS